MPTSGGVMMGTIVRYAEQRPSWEVIPHEHEGRKKSQDRRPRDGTHGHGEGVNQRLSVEGVTGEIDDVREGKRALFGLQRVDEQSEERVDDEHQQEEPERGHPHRCRDPQAPEHRPRLGRGDGRAHAPAAPGRAGWEASAG